MVSIDDQSFDNMFSHHDMHDYARYPDPPHSGSTYDASNTSPMDVNGMYGLSSSADFDPAAYGETPNFFIHHNGRMSPGMYLDESDMHNPPSSLSTNSASATSSAAASPQSNPSHHMGAMPASSKWHLQSLHPSIVGNDYLSNPEYATYCGQGVDEYGYEFAQSKSFVDPSLIQSDMHRGTSIGLNIPSYDISFQPLSHQAYPASPSAASSPHHNMARNGSTSPFLNEPFHATPTYPNSPMTVPGAPSTRRPSTTSPVSPSSGDCGSSDETKEKQRCTYPDCGKAYKDLKAHMLTHQNERPEKCPIQTCEYHTKGFARKYDKNRHTLTHYKGTMVCGFCPGSGSALEKSFNRADVFKRHLTSVHGVEQTPPNSRKKTPGSMSTGAHIAGYAPDATGKCSTCSQTFSNAQDFYEHLDDCVLRIVQQEDPSEAINARCLTEMDEDEDVQETLERNLLVATPSSNNADDDEDDEDMADDVDDDGSVNSASPQPRKKGTQSNGIQKSRGMTHARTGVSLQVAKKGRKNRDRRFPPSWGYDPTKMTLKHRVLAVFDGPRRLAKDDMALSTAHEVRLRLSDGKSYTTDLDIQTIKRAQGFHSATEEEKGPWISDDPSEAQFREMQRMQSGQQ